MTNTAFVFAISTAQPLFALKIRRTKSQTAIPRECLLGGCVLCTQVVNRKPIQGVLIYGMCLFEVGISSRSGGENMSAELDGCTVRLRRVVGHAWRTKRSGTAFSRFVLQTPRMPFVACNELAIATKSIASVSPPRTMDSFVENYP